MRFHNHVADLCTKLLFLGFFCRRFYRFILLVHRLLRLSLHELGQVIDGFLGRHSCAARCTCSSTEERLELLLGFFIRGLARAQLLQL